MGCDYRKKECADTGTIIDNRWVCDNHVSSPLLEEPGDPDAVQIATDLLSRISHHWRLVKDKTLPDLFRIVIGTGRWQNFEHHNKVNAEFSVACATFLVRDLIAEIKNLRNYQSTINLNVPDAYRQRTLDVSVVRMREEIRKLRGAIEDHRAQKADDRCIEDDDRLYEALGDGIKCDRRVGDKAAMLANCARFIDKRCEGGGWPTYAELEAEVESLRLQLDAAKSS